MLIGAQTHINDSLCLQIISQYELVQGESTAYISTRTNFKLMGKSGLRVDSKRSALV